MIGFLTVIISVSLSGVVAVWLTHALTTRKDRKELYRIKLEDIYISFHQWSKYVVGRFNYMYPLFERKITYDQYLDGIIDSGKSFDGLYSEKLNMTIKFYYPILWPSLEIINALVGKLNDLDFLFKSEIKGNYSGDIDYIDTLNRFMGVLADAIENMSKAIENEAQKL